MALQKLTIDDLGAEATLPELKADLVEMLSALADFCESNGIRYYLSGGTLLGAVRHKGFIPWDDDIDINIPRPDCEKLQELSGGMIAGRYFLQRPDPSCVFHAECWRLYDYSMIIESNMGRTSKKSYFLPVFIDIFPIEGLPSDYDTMARQYKKIKLNRLFLYSGVLNAWKGKTLFKKLVHLGIRPFSKLIGTKTFFNNIQNLGLKNRFDDCEYIGVVTAPAKTVEEWVKKEEYIPQIDVTFEGKTFKGPKGYDTYLSQLYGKDYMQMPPADKQVSHHGFKLYYNKERKPKENA